MMRLKRLTKQRFYTENGKVKPITPRKKSLGTHQKTTAHLTVPKPFIQTHRIPSSTVDGLYIYYKNDRFLMSKSEAWSMNFARKMRNRKYDELLARRAIEKNLVPEIIKKFKSDYHTEYLNSYYLGKVPKADKKIIAEQIFPGIEERARWEVTYNHKKWS